MAVKRRIAESEAERDGDTATVTDPLTSRLRSGHALVEDHRLVDLAVEARARVRQGDVITPGVVSCRCHASATSTSAELEGEIVLAELTGGNECTGQGVLDWQLCDREWAYPTQGSVPSITPLT